MYHASVSDTITVSKARAALPQILQRVRAGEEVTITRHGEPVAVVVRPDTLRARRASKRMSDADRVRDVIVRSRKAKLHPRPTLSEQQASAPGGRSGSPLEAVTRSGMDAFDADVLIYAAVADHQLGMRVRALFPIQPVVGTGAVAGIGSVLLLPELLTKPLREGAIDELSELGALLGRLDLRPVDEATAELATALGAAYRLRAADAVHLATAVNAGADRFITNNAADFPKTIAEVDITYPVDLTG